jgi:hypothetical protein
MKPIKPSALKSAAMLKALNDELKRTASEILFDYEVTAWNWQHKVKFKKVISIGPNSTDILVGTDDPIYGYVDLGTKKHTIQAKKGKMLAFRVGGSPKTQPGVMVSGSGSSGKELIFAKKVKVKTRARNFSKNIKKSWDKKFKNRMQKAMNQAVKDSGHEYK